MSECVKVASRYLLPVELLLGFSTCAWGIAGGLGAGGLGTLLASQDVDELWVMMLGVTGMLQCAVAAFEWRRGRTWSVTGLYRSVSVRCTLAFVSAPCWLYALYVFIVLRGPGIYALMLLAPAYLAFACWVFVENLKVRYALDARYPTSRLQFHR